MESNFGNNLRNLRHKRAVSRRSLADKSGIALRTLAYWESGERLPRIPELQTVLEALNATPEESARLLNEMKTARSLRYLQEWKTAEDRRDLPGINDLVRALRLRSRLTQAQLAERLKVSRRTVLLWEAGENLIGDENLERLCDLLGAAPEERVALRERRLTLPGEKWNGGAFTLENVTYFWERLADSFRADSPNYRPQQPLFELNVLAYKRQIMLHRPNVAGTLPLVARIDTDYAGWLYAQDRLDEAQPIVKRVLDIMHSDTPQKYWADALNLSCTLLCQKKSGSEKSIARTEQWLPRLPAGLVRTYQLSDLAVYHSMIGNQWEAYTSLADAERSLDRAGEVTAAEQFYYHASSERVKMVLSGDSFLSEAVLAQSPNDANRVYLLYVWADKLLSKGERGAAKRWIARAQEMITPGTPPRLIERTLSLAQRL